ncbi:MAG TPA: DUF4390 domain-containing protein [Burkholderiaceae bacterium]|nr:DUF4390 domain-containing protein [Burkholderiaceae bacterium]
MRASALSYGGQVRERFHLALAAARRLWSRVGCVALLLALAGAPWHAQAEDRITVSHAAFSMRSGADPGTFVDAQFELELPSSLREAVDHGIALYFVIEVEVTRSRWYWFDKHLLDDAIEYRLSFSPLTRQYRLARGALAQPFDSLDQALGTMRRVTQWRIGDSDLFEGSNTHGRIRMRLDTSMLPKPFQVSALTDPDWMLASDWSRLTRTSDSPN